MPRTQVLINGVIEPTSARSLDFCQISNRSGTRAAVPSSSMKFTNKSASDWRILKGNGSNGLIISGTSSAAGS